MPEDGNSEFMKPAAPQNREIRRQLGAGQGTLADKQRHYTLEAPAVPEQPASFVCVLCLTDIPCGSPGCAGTWIKTGA